MQVRQEMRTFPVRAIGLAVALLLAVLLAGSAGYALRGFAFSSSTTVTAPAVNAEQSRPHEQAPDAIDRNRAAQPQELPYVVDGLAAIPAVG